MSRQAFGDPHDRQEPAQLCPVCGGEWHAEDCVLGKEVSRRLRAEAEAAKSERRAITFGDIMHTQVLAMRAAVVDAKLNGPEAGMAWIENTLEGPGHLPDVAAAKAEGGAQCMFNREMAEHEAFRAAHPAPGA